MEPRFLDAVRAAFPAGSATLTLGAPVLKGECQPEPLVGLPLAMMNRHGLVAGATGTGCEPVVFNDQRKLVLHRFRGDVERVGDVHVYAVHAVGVWPRTGAATDGLGAEIGFAVRRLAAVERDGRKRVVAGCNT